MNKLNIDIFNLDYNNDDKFELDKKDFELLTKQFKMKVKYPESYYEFKKIHYKILNDLSNDLCNKKLIRNGKDRYINYFINNELIYNELELHYIKNKNKYDLEYDYILEDDNIKIIKVDKINKINFNNNDFLI